MSYLIPKKRTASITEYEWSDTEGEGKLLSFYDLPLQKTIYNNVEELLEEFGASSGEIAVERATGGLFMSFITDDHDHIQREVYVGLWIADTLREFEC